jgi:hypothetical protein
MVARARCGSVRRDACRIVREGKAKISAWIQYREERVEKNRLSLSADVL